MNLERGTLVLVTLDPTLGHEQRGFRPAVVVSDDELAAGQRFSMLCVVPVTSTLCQGELYPALAAGGRSGLRKRSFALVDQVRSIDKQRVSRVLGRLSGSELVAIDRGLLLFLGLSGIQDT